MRDWTARLAGAALLAAATIAAQAQPAPGLTVTPPSGQAAPLAWAELESLPSSTLTLAGERGAMLHVAGPTLWTVLNRAGAVDADVHRRVSQVVVATGSDGYSATLAMGELDPEFENKGVLLAIDPERHSLRIAIPGDKRLGRDVRDVVRLVVRDAAAKGSDGR